MNNENQELKISVEGFLSWALVDSGGQAVQSGQQHNLITDTGLEYIGYVGFRGIQAWGIVGTGTTPPAFTDTAMAASLGTTSRAGTDNGTITLLSDGKYALKRVVQFDENEVNGNLTEWGFSSGQNGNVCVRELFRDGGGAPIVLTKTSDYKLILTYTLEVQLGPVVSTPHTLTLTGVGDIPSAYSMRQGPDNLGAHYYPSFYWFESMVQGQSQKMDVLSGGAFVGPNYQSYFGAPGDGVSGVVPPYVPGTHSRAGQTHTFDVDRANGPVSGLQYWANNYYSNRVMVYIYAFNAGNVFTKDSDHRLTVTGPAFSWGRAVVDAPGAS